MLINNYPRLSLAYVIIKDVLVERKDCELVDKIETEIAKLYSIESLVNNPIIRAYRDFFWSLNVDPTKIRPASEALVRRILRRGKLPRINNAVDAMNVISAKTLISMSIFNLDRISFPITLEPAGGDEKFIDISGHEFKFVKNFPKLVDSEGKIVAAVPFRDGFYTKVDVNTKNIFLLAYAPATVEKYVIRNAAREASELIIKCAGGKIEKI